MTDHTTAHTEATEPALSINRVFNAPRDLVWKAYTEPERLEQWWGAPGYTTRVVSLDLRPGGVFHYSQQIPNGGEMWGKFVYREIVAPERLVFVSSFSDPEGNTTRAPFSPDWPLEILTTVTLTEQDGRTTVTIQSGPINATEAELRQFAEWRPMLQQGFAGTLDRLDAHLADG